MQDSACPDCPHSNLRRSRGQGRKRDAVCRRCKDASHFGANGEGEAPGLEAVADVICETKAEANRSIKDPEGEYFKFGAQDGLVKDAVEDNPRPRRQCDFVYRTGNSQNATAPAPASAPTPAPAAAPSTDNGGIDYDLQLGLVLSVSMQQAWASPSHQ